MSIMHIMLRTIIYTGHTASYKEYPSHKKIMLIRNKYKASNNNKYRYTSTFVLYHPFLRTTHPALIQNLKYHMPELQYKTTSPHTDYHPSLHVFVSLLFCHYFSNVRCFYWKCYQLAQKLINYHPRLQILFVIFYDFRNYYLYMIILFSLSVPVEIHEITYLRIKI